MIYLLPLTVKYMKYDRSAAKIVLCPPPDNDRSYMVHILNNTNAVEFPTFYEFPSFDEFPSFSNFLLFTNFLLLTNFPLFSNFLLFTNFLLLTNYPLFSNFLLLTNFLLFTNFPLFSNFLPIANFLLLTKPSTSQNNFLKKHFSLWFNKFLSLLKVKSSTGWT